ncbi:hypothetical protein OVA12_22000 [Pannonibacter sp. SL95]|nr:hypothetical protein [Pannonibacter sp. SL95]MCY1708682.1 hypothetical protein [Pannonibacter sp. SL95]
MPKKYARSEYCSRQALTGASADDANGPRHSLLKQLARLAFALTLMNFERYAVPQHHLPESSCNPDDHRSQAGVPCSGLFPSAFKARPVDLSGNMEGLGDDIGAAEPADFFQKAQPLLRVRGRLDALNLPEILQQILLRVLEGPAKRVIERSGCISHAQVALVGRDRHILRSGGGNQLRERTKVQRMRHATAFHRQSKLRRPASRSEPPCLQGACA